MKITRRKFLAAAPLVAGAVMQFNGVALGQLAGRSRFTDPLARLGWSSFYPYINTAFTFTGAEGTPFEMRLANMIDNVAESQRSGLQGECFSLIFRPTQGQVLTQDVYRVEHFALGRFDLLITVGGTENGSTSYDALINRTSVSNILTV